MKKQQCGRGVRGGTYGTPPPKRPSVPPAKQNGVAQGGGVRASDGTTLVFPTKRRGSPGQVCDICLRKGGFSGVLRWI